jgi:hypothetical protein
VASHRAPLDLEYGRDVVAELTLDGQAGAVRQPTRGPVRR